MFGFFETRLDPTKDTPDVAPPGGAVAFYWHYARQAKGLLSVLFVGGALTALLDLLIPLFIGRVVTLVSSHTPEEVFRDYGWQLAGMAAIQLGLRPAALFGPGIAAGASFAARAAIIHAALSASPCRLIPLRANTSSASAWS